MKPKNAKPSFRRRPESSGLIQHAFGFVLAAQVIFKNWIPACAGMTEKRRVDKRSASTFSMVDALRLSTLHLNLMTLKKVKKELQ